MFGDDGPDQVPLGDVLAAGLPGPGILGNIFPLPRIGLNASDDSA